MQVMRVNPFRTWLARAADYASRASGLKYVIRPSLFLAGWPALSTPLCYPYLNIGNCFLHHITAPDFSKKDETVLKKNFQNMCSGFFLPEWNFILRTFLSRMGFLLLFPDFHFRNTIISFLDFFFWNVLFSIPNFFCPK